MFKDDAGDDDGDEVQSHTGASSSSTATDCAPLSNANFLLCYDHTKQNVLAKCGMAGVTAFTQLTYGATASVASPRRVTISTHSRHAANTVQEFNNILAASPTSLRNYLQRRPLQEQFKLMAPVTTHGRVSSSSVESLNAANAAGTTSNVRGLSRNPFAMLQSIVEAEETRFNGRKEVGSSRRHPHRPPSHRTNLATCNHVGGSQALARREWRTPAHSQDTGRYVADQGLQRSEGASRERAYH